MVELYNPTLSTVGIGGWMVNTTQGKNNSYTISAGTQLLPGAFWTITLPGLFIDNDGDMLILLNSQRVRIDETPLLSDPSSPGDTRTWQRTPDVGTEWQFREETRGRSNSQTTTTTQQTAATSQQLATTTTSTTWSATTTQQVTTSTTQVQTTTTSTRQQATTTTAQQHTTTWTSQQYTTTTQTSQVQSSGMGFAFAVIGIGAGAAAVGIGVAVAMSGSEVYAYGGYYYCRKHNVPVWWIQGRLWCPAEGRFLKP